MEASLKAKELVEKYRMYDIMITDLMGCELDGYEEKHYKQCALIAVDEIIGYIASRADAEMTDNEIDIMHQKFDYWEQVRTEIEKL